MTRPGYALNATEQNTQPDAKNIRPIHAVELRRSGSRSKSGSKSRGLILFWSLILSISANQASQTVQAKQSSEAFGAPADSKQDSLDKKSYQSLLNKEGLKAFGARDYELAVFKFEQAHKADPNDITGRQNLVIAYDTLGLQLLRDPNKALINFHKALYLDPGNETTRWHLDKVLSALGKGTDSFKERELLGKQAEMSGDFSAAIVEYGAACGIHDDLSLRSKMQNLISAQQLRGNPADYIPRLPDAVAYLRYLADVQLRIRRSWIPTTGSPPAVVKFRVLETGEPSNVWIESSSGIYNSDRAARFAVLNAGPFRQLPYTPATAGKHLDLQITFDSTLPSDVGTNHIKRF